MKRTMTIFRTILLSAFIFNSAWAGTYPTIWHIKNLTSSNKHFSCIGDSDDLDNPIKIDIAIIHPSSEFLYKWDEYHNGGMGLHAAKWNCKTNQGNKTSFQTHLGEDLTIELHEDKTDIKAEFMSDGLYDKQYIRFNKW